MSKYNPPKQEFWTGRKSNAQLYLHEKVQCVTIDQLEEHDGQFVLLGYACDEGIRLNQGRIGAKEGPKAIRKALAKMPHHLLDHQKFVDVGDLVYDNGALDEIQKALTERVSEILQKKGLPILLGGGHDIAYGHYNGIKKFLMSKKKRPAIGIINFDAHLDLREDSNGANSGTPFFQIANENEPFHYLCLGIRRDANDKTLFDTAQKLNVTYVMRNAFRIEFAKEINVWIRAFMENVDHIYVTVDMDGFSSAFAPGVSAASPMGFSPEVVLESLETIVGSGKLISIDFAETNPNFDNDGQTAKLAASLIHFVIHCIEG